MGVKVPWLEQRLLLSPQEGAILWFVLLEKECAVLPRPLRFQGTGGRSGHILEKPKAISPNSKSINMASIVKIVKITEFAFFIQQY